MRITDCSFTNSDTEYNLIKELLLEVETYPDIDNNWDPGRMDFWRYNVHAEKGVDFFQANAHYWKTDILRPAYVHFRVPRTIRRNWIW